MAKVVDVKLVDNSEEVLEALSEKVTNWLEAIGEDAAGTAADRAPVDTGRLKSSISHAVVESENARYKCRICTLSGVRYKPRNTGKALHSVWCYCTSGRV